MLISQLELIELVRNVDLSKNAEKVLEDKNKDAVKSSSCCCRPIRKYLLGKRRNYMIKRLENLRGQEIELEKVPE